MYTKIPLRIAIVDSNPLTDEKTKDNRLKSLIYVLQVAAIVFAIDQLTKLMVTRNLELYESWEPFPGLGDFFQITYTFIENIFV